MKKIILLYTILLMLFNANNNIVIAQTTVPNNGFENWTDAYTATGWNAVSLLTIHSLQRSTDSHSGTYAAKLATQSILGQTIPGITALGSINIASQQVAGGTPFVGRPTSLKGYFKYTPVGNDSMLIAIILTKKNGNGKDTVGGGIFTNKNAVNSYTQFTIPISYNSSVTGNPDTMNIILLSSATATGGIGTTLLIDDLSMDYPSSVNDIQQFDFKLFPNPASDLITINCKNNNSNLNNVVIYNITGQEVYSNTFNTSQFKINISELKEGVYFVKTTNENYHRIQKLIVKHNNE